eukprot:c11052_g1_i1.p1 GENE.c11052_g1_i1~~c11052_g1_i1.p1  ORF type:complete len:704 (+),score=173.11 c11052_g1_i1:37-2148(+)
MKHFSHMLGGWFALLVFGLLPKHAITLPFEHHNSRNLRHLSSQDSVEDMFLSVPSSESAKASLWHYTRNPHVAGTQGDKDLAYWTRDQMRSLGLDSEVVSVNVSLTYPVRRSLQLQDEAGQVIYTASLSEDILAQDNTSDTIWRNLTFNGYAPSGKSKAPLVYANFGRPEDFDALEQNNVSVSGSIVIVRYGSCFRGLKAMNAEKRGAIGTIIYSDPAQDGYAKGPVYPAGPWRPSSSVQRGSVQFNSLCAGDPNRAYLGPSATFDLCGYEPNALVPQHPVIPISYGDALPLLQALGGPVAPSSFQGALNATYRLGPSLLLVDLETENEFVPSTPIWNVVTTIPGTLSAEDDRHVLIGNHRDAWVFGAADPNSGSAALIEIAKGFAALLQSGWQPDRTLVLLSWSGEEYGLLGSTAWAEVNAPDLYNKALVYLNVDVGVSGDKFSASGTPALESAVLNVLQKVQDPLRAVPLAEVWDKDYGVLGSGSDYTVMLDNLGIASVDLGFDNGGSYGTYHSTYDSFDWVATQADPTFQYHKAIAQVWGLLALRLATASVLPFNHTAQADAIDQYIATVQRQLPNPAPVSLAPLATATASYRSAAANVSQLVESLSLAHSSSEPAVASLNDRLAFTERRFLSRDGLPGRKFFKHVLQAPGLYLGYGADVLPGVTQAVQDANWDLAAAQVQVAAQCITDAALYLAGSTEY